MDPDEEGFMTWDRLQAVMEEQMKPKNTPQDLMDQLKKLDKSGLGKIDIPLFKNYMRTLGNKMQEHELDDFIKFVDPKSEGSIDIEELSIRMCPPLKDKK